MSTAAEKATSIVSDISFMTKAVSEISQSKAKKIYFIYIQGNICFEKDKYVFYC